VDEERRAVKVSSEHKVEMVFEISEGLQVESGRDMETGSTRKVVRIWSRSDESAADAVTKIIQMSDSLVAALREQQ
jgi:hypothetical protein